MGTAFCFGVSLVFVVYLVVLWQGVRHRAGSEEVTVRSSWVAFVVLFPDGRCWLCAAAALYLLVLRFSCFF